MASVQVLYTVYDRDVTAAFTGFYTFIYAVQLCCQFFVVNRNRDTVVQRVCRCSDERKCSLSAHTTQSFSFHTDLHEWHLHHHLSLCSLQKKKKKIHRSLACLMSGIVSQWLKWALAVNLHIHESTNTKWGVALHLRNGIPLWDFFSTAILMGNVWMCKCELTEMGFGV